MKIDQKLEGVIEVLRKLFVFECVNESSPCQWTLEFVHEPHINTNSVLRTERLEFDEVLQVLNNNPRQLRLNTGGFVEVVPHKKLIKVGNSSPLGLANDCYRILRQLVIAQSMEQSYACLHASCVARNGKAIAFVGPKGAGKTSLSSRLASVLSGSLLSNDKLLVSSCGLAVHLFEAPAVTIETIISSGTTDTCWERVRAIDGLAADVFIDHPKLPTYDSLLRMDRNKKLFFSEMAYLALNGISGVMSAELKSIILIDRERGRLPSLTTSSIEDQGDVVDNLEPFPDWLGIRGNGSWGFPNIQIPIFKLSPSNSIDDTVSLLASQIVNLEMGEMHS